MTDKKRSAAAKKAAQTRKENEEKAQAEQAQEEPREETQEERDSAGDARRDRVRTPGQRGKDPEQVYEPVHEPLQASDLDQHSLEEKRQAELTAARDEHNRRTGDASRGIRAEVGSK